MPNKTKQYTIRNVPCSVDRALRKKARALGLSLNETIISVLKIEMQDGAVIQRKEKGVDQVELDCDWEGISLPDLHGPF